MQEQLGLKRSVNIAKSALWGFVGSTAGAVVGFSVGWAIGSTTPGWEGLYIFLLMGYFLAGAGVGTALGTTARTQRIILVALAGAFTFAIAFLVALFVGRQGVTQGVIFGGFAGAVLGSVLRGRKTAGFLALAGAIACAIVFPAQLALRAIAQHQDSSILVVVLNLSGQVISIVVLGVTLGTVFGYLESRTVGGEC